MEDLIDRCEFLSKLGEQKQVQIQRMDTIKIRQCLGKVGYNEKWLRKESRVMVMAMLARVMSEEEEKEIALGLEKEQAKKKEKNKGKRKL